MSIGKAVQKGTLIYIYDHNGKQITSVSAPGRWPEDGLKSFTANTVSIQKGSLIYHYDESGRCVGRPHPAQAPLHAVKQIKREQCAA
ncbi:hypothetical protein [Thiothrix subterranea]|uniref:Uncharacterized protein n=1 Tax=Thiothrix subterranea TaxID=2735563 RepID=A0AA51MJ65_9GAMM|nr:hypothetical protein [Thiothrix subterranea]MDQ5768035.1 hypothetical protein [Thiothrix subterranea]WML85203.1 hypothetical protein RCG00_12905 [Thiothrix subterranea]